MCRVIYHPKYSLYNLGDSHPFSPQRVQMLIELLIEWELYEEPIQPSPVSADDLKIIHAEKYIEISENLSKGKQEPDPELYGFGTSDNPILKGITEGARYQVGGTLLGAQLLIQDKAKRVLTLGGGFHHAHYNQAAGFCIYNDLSMAIKEMTKHKWHVAYIDIDVHHGDGVQEMFYSDGNVITISVHESGEYLFPGRGWVHELGNGIGRSLKLNIPLEPFSEGDSYLEVIDKVIKPALTWFKPDALVVQAGADAHFSDPLADNLLTTQDYEIIFRKIIDLADSTSKGRVLFTLGGGYSPTATPRIWAILYLLLKGIKLPEMLPKRWRKKWQTELEKPIPITLHDKLPAFFDIPRSVEILKTNKDTITRLMDAVAQYWI